MKKPIIPENEEWRLAALYNYDVLDTMPEPSFDDITAIASQICDTPIALVSLIDENRQWFKSNHGIEVKEIPREQAYCAHAINDPYQIMEVTDAEKDERFAGNPLLTGPPYARFYAGAPLVTKDGYPLGTLCVIDHQPRKLTDTQRSSLAALSRQIVTLLEMRKNERALMLTQSSFVNSSVGLAWVDEGAQVIKFNDRYAKIIGFPREILVKKRIYEFDPNFDEEKWKAHWQEMTEKKTMVLESNTCGKDGQVKPIELRLKMMEFQGKRYIHAICMDITERKLAEAQIKQSEANLTALIENSSDTIWSINRQYHYITFNSVFRNIMLNLTGQEPVEGQRINFESFSEEVADYWKDLYKRAFEGEHFIRNVQMEQGEKIVTLETSFNPIQDENGNVIGASVFSRDVTARFEEAQRKNRFQDGLKRLNDLASNNQMSFRELMNRALMVITEFLEMPLGLLSKIDKGRYRVLSYHSNDDSFQFQPGQIFDLEGTYCDITYRKDEVIAIDAMSTSPYMEYAMTCYEGRSVESYIGAVIYVNNEKYGTVNFCDKVAREVPFDSYDKEFLQLLANWIGSEIGRRLINEELMRAKDKAEAASIAKDNFLSTISHEIRTPLNAVIGMTHILLNEDPAPKQVEYLNTIKFSGENLLALINDILDYNKIEADKLIIDKQSFSLKEVLLGIKGSIEFRAQEKGIRFKFIYDEKYIPEVLIGDPFRIAQVINNLVGNAVKFTESGWVKLSVVAAKNSAPGKTLLHVEVEDTGIGIRKEKLKIIFERFVQAESSTTRKFGGTGLGLAITRKLLTMMDSQIGVESEPDKGTKFFFDLELDQAGEHEITEHTFEAKERIDLAACGLKVLVAEDNDANLLVISKFLTSWGIAADFAKDGNEVLEKITRQCYDMVLMDLQMPITDGFIATREIRKMEGTYFQQVPILALTASVMNNVKEKAMMAGMNDYITKPFAPADLYRKISMYVEKRPSDMVRVDKGIKIHEDAFLSEDFDQTIQRLTGGNEDFGQKLIESYIRNLVELKNMFPEAVKHMDREKAARMIHKVKPTLSTLRANKLQELIEKGERMTLVASDQESSLESFTREFELSCDNLTRQLNDLIYNNGDRSV